MTTGTNNSTKKRLPYFSSYDPSIFYTPFQAQSSKPCKPVRNLVKNPIRLTISLKDIGLEGLDSSSPDKASDIRQREKQKKQEELKKATKKVTFKEEKKSDSPPPPPPLSPRIRKILKKTGRTVPIYEGTFYQSTIDTNKIIDLSSDPKPIGLLSSSSKGQKPQPTIPKATPRGSPRLNTSASASGSGIFNVDEEPAKPNDNNDGPIESVMNQMADALAQNDIADDEDEGKEKSNQVPEGDIPFEEQIRRDNEDRIVDINDAPVPVPEGDIPFEEQIRRDNEDRIVDINDAPVPAPEGDIPFEEQIKRDNEDRIVDITQNTENQPQDVPPA